LNYSLIYSRTSRDQARSLHPLIKPNIRARIKALRENPYLGKNLQRELSGNYSLRVKRHRVIYKIKASNNQIEIHFIGHRKDIYQLFREGVEKDL
jgi:mRNA-degrading endonuclease RelE of RelBE toxin-antitoxin system